MLFYVTVLFVDAGCVGRQVTSYDVISREKN